MTDISKRVRDRFTQPDKEKEPSIVYTETQRERESKILF